ncbi:LysR family transcriptional regulator [Pigmentiphaga soli]|uniref:LysR family transcriptional regulator n=1 Tax=Pigmentiphaga soli TaxID=1007095 RepID=A0ABP8HS31_9BURK
MELRDLKYFVAIAESGNTRRAAALMHRSQPTLIKAVDRLEASLGVRLFERDGRGQTLSAAGRALLNRATSLLGMADDVRNEVDAHGRGTAGLVRLGCGPLGAEYLLPRISLLLLAEAPDIALQVRVSINYEMRRELREGTLDLILGFVPDGEDQEFAFRTLLKDTVVVAARRGHPVFRRRNLRLDALAPYRWALPNTSVPSRTWLDAVFERQGLARPVPQIETNSLSLIPQVVAETDLLGFVSRRMLAGVDALREVPLAGTTLYRNFGVTYLKDRPQSPVVERLAALLHAKAAPLFKGTANN